jgi:NAD dependent epimerase/dehydratase
MSSGNRAQTKALSSQPTDLETWDVVGNMVCWDSFVVSNQRVSSGKRAYQANAIPRETLTSLVYKTNHCSKCILVTGPTVSSGWMNLYSKRILVTGADGFIGSHLVEHLVRAGAQVTALAQYNSFNFWGWLEEIPSLNEIKVVTGDIRDSHFCLKLLKNIDILFHLAALIPIPYSYRAPDSYIDTNIKGTLNLCQAALASEVQKFIHTSTSEVYGTAKYIPIDEKHPLNAQSPYSASKIGADAIGTSFYCSFQLPLVIARPFNTYGARQSARAVIPTIISQIAAGANEVELGDLNTTRDFTFVDDTCGGLLAIARLDSGFGEVFQIGSDQEISIGDLFKLISESMNSQARIKIDANRIRPGKSEVLRLRCDNRKLLDASGFRPQVSLREGLRRTIDWFQNSSNLRRYKRFLYNV